MIVPIPVNTPILAENAKKYLVECIETNWISSEGPFVKRFEKEFTKCVGRKYGIAVCNGSAALDLAIAVLGISRGDEVIMPTFTIISCASAIIRVGAKPVLVDCDPETWNMDILQIENKITDRTKAIMVVHIYGLPVDVRPALELAKKYNLRVIEDAAEAHGQSYKDKPCGSFGDVSTFSFYPNKHVTTGEGGMLVTDSEELAEHGRSLRNLCFGRQNRFVHEELGWNFRLTNLQAALGLAQLEKLNEFVIIKRRIGRKYNELLNDFNGIQLPLPRTDYAENIYWVYGVVLKDEITFNANKAIKFFAEHKIGTRPFFWPMHQQPVFKKMGLFEGENYPVAENLARKGFYLPSGLALKDQQIEYVVNVFKKVLSYGRF